MAKKSYNQLARMRPRIGLALALALAAGCASPATTNSTAYRSIARRSVRGSTTHTVAPGETLYRIGRQYGIDSGRIMAANGLADPRDLRVGQLLIIPAGSADDVALPATASAFSLPNPWSVTPADRQFAWPVTAGMVSSPFGMRNGAMHDGVDIAAPAGTPVYAADDGTVIFAGRLHGYGNVVIVQHADGYTTVYGHNQHNLATVGTRVARGQQIAEIGTSGRTSGPNLHFEVRRNNQAENPLAYLPPPAATTGISFARNGGS